MAKRYCVRVVQTRMSNGQEVNEGGDLGTFVECLRNAGLVTVHTVDPDPNGLTSRCFDIECPHKHNTEVWAEANAARMRSFGYNAVAAPSTVCKTQDLPSR